MSKLYLFILIVIAIIAAGIFFSPKAECGKDIGFGTFPKYRCSCFGFVERTPDFRGPMYVELDSTIDYSCFGIKTGKTKLVSENLGMVLELCSNHNLCTYPKEITLEKGESETSKIIIQNTNESATSYTLLVVKGDAYTKNQTKIENTLGFSYDQSIIDLQSNDKKIISLSVNSDKETKAGIYVFKIDLVDMSNQSKGKEVLYVIVN